MGWEEMRGVSCFLENDWGGCLSLKACLSSVLKRARRSLDSGFLWSWKKDLSYISQYVNVRQFVKRKRP